MKLKTSWEKVVVSWCSGFPHHSWSGYCSWAYCTWLSSAGGWGRLSFAGSILTYTSCGFPSEAWGYTCRNKVSV